MVEEISETEYGVGLRIFTKDVKKYEQKIDKLEMGKITFNSGALFDGNLPI